MQINKLFKNFWILILILMIGAFLRFWKLGTVPPGLTQDEVALGYNSYSILKTGKDEYGKFMPIIFKSFGDYKPGLYVYLDVPFTAAFGLNEVSTRMPSALAGIISVLLIYLICLKLFGKKIALFSAFIASITPWLIYFSRGAWEANVSLVLTLTGIYFFLCARDRSVFIIPSVISFALTILAYQGAKLSSLIVALILIAVYWQEILKLKKSHIFVSLIFGVIISTPIFLSLFNGQSGRLDVFSIFSYPRPVSYTQAFLNEGSEKIGDLNYYLFHSEAFNFVRGISGRYFNHFSAKFLFFDGDYQNPQHSAPYQGMLLVGDLFILIIGVVALIRRGLGKESIFIWLWLSLSPLPAILSRDQVQSVRALNMAVPLIMILGFGLNYILDMCNRLGKLKFVGYSILVALYTASFVYFTDAYYVHVPAHNSQYWNYGYKQLVDKILLIKSEFKNIFVEQSFSQPYIYFLYYQKYDPPKYQTQANLNSSPNPSDVGLIERLDNINFVQIDWSYLRNQHGTLVAIDGVTPIPTDLSYSVIEKINYLNNRDLAFELIEIK